MTEILSLSYTASTTALKLHPSDLTVREGQVARFHCKVQCSHKIYWAVGSLDSYNRTLAIDNSGRIENFKRLTGMTVELEKISSSCRTMGNDGFYIPQLRILAKAQFNNTAVQCSVVDRATTSTSSIINHSRYAVMTVIGKYWYGDIVSSFMDHTHMLESQDT